MQSKGNPLLIKPQLGCARRSAYNLPADDQFMYGKATLPDGLTAKLVVNNWATSTGKPSKDRLPSRDFRALNKSAISAGESWAPLTEHMRRTSRHTRAHSPNVASQSLIESAPISATQVSSTANLFAGTRRCMTSGYDWAAIKGRRPCRLIQTPPLARRCNLRRPSAI